MIEICGWIGAILVLYAYFMVSSGKVDGSCHKFQTINIVGALFLVVYTYGCQAYASMVVNLIWVGIGIHTALKNTKEVLMATRIKVLAGVVALFALIGTNALNAQDMDYSESSEESIVEESGEGSTYDEESEEVNSDSQEVSESSEEF